MQPVKFRKLAHLCYDLPCRAHAAQSVQEATHESTTVTMTEGEDDGLEYCFCRKGFREGEFMIYCDSCSEWYHGRCVNIDQAKAAAIEEYRCNSCVEKVAAEERMKNKTKKLKQVGLAGFFLKAGA